MEDKKQHGGRRSGAGRPANDRSIMVGVRITKEAADILNAQPNKSEFIDNLISMKTYSFTYINQWGNGEVVDIEEFATDTEAQDFGKELLNGCTQDISLDAIRGDWQNPEMIIDKWENGYPSVDTFGTEDEVDPIATFNFVAELFNT